MKKIILSTILLSILTFACTDNPLFKVSLNIPYEGNYTIKAANQAEGQLIIQSDEDSYSTFVSTVNEEMIAHGIKGDFTADIIYLALTIPEKTELDWSVLGEVWITFTLNGEPHPGLDGISFPAERGKTLKVGLPEGGISINDFLAYENASLKIVADISHDLLEDIPLSISAEVAIRTKKE